MRFAILVGVVSLIVAMGALLLIKMVIQGPPRARWIRVYEDHTATTGKTRLYCVMCVDEKGINDKGCEFPCPPEHVLTNDWSHPIESCQSPIESNDTCRYAGIARTKPSAEYDA